MQQFALNAHTITYAATHIKREDYQISIWYFHLQNIKLLQPRNRMITPCVCSAKIFFE